MEGRLIGADLGGTKLSVTRMHEGTLELKRISPTDKSSAEALLEEIVGAVGPVRTHDTVAVGVGIPAAIDFATGQAKSGVNVPLEGVPVRRILSEHLGLPVFVDNDANCAAIAEAHDDDGRLVVSNLVMFTVGTGVGGGLVLAGRPYRGATGAAGEMGHQIIGMQLEHGVPEQAGSFPQPGSLEGLAAGRALDGIAQRVAHERPESALGRAAAGNGHVTGVDAVREAKAGDPDALAAVRLLGERLGVGIANALNVFDPEVVAIGGGVSIAGDLLLGPAVEVAKRLTLPGVGERAEIRLSRYGPEAGVRGAALMAALALREEVAVT
jgi:glucokinase